MSDAPSIVLQVPAAGPEDRVALDKPIVISLAGTVTPAAPDVDAARRDASQTRQDVIDEAYKTTKAVGIPNNRLNAGMIAATHGIHLGKISKDTDLPFKLEDAKVDTSAIRGPDGLLAKANAVVAEARTTPYLAKKPELQKKYADEIVKIYKEITKVLGYPPTDKNVETVMKIYTYHLKMKEAAAQAAAPQATPPDAAAPVATAPKPAGAPQAEAPAAKVPPVEVAKPVAATEPKAEPSIPTAVVNPPSPEKAAAPVGQPAAVANVETESRQQVINKYHSRANSLGLKNNWDNAEIIAATQGIALSAIADRSLRSKDFIPAEAALDMTEVNALLAKAKASSGQESYKFYKQITAKLGEQISDKLGENFGFEATSENVRTVMKAYGVKFRSETSSDRSTAQKSQSSPSRGGKGGAERHDGPDGSGLIVAEPYRIHTRGLVFNRDDKMYAINKSVKASEATVAGKITGAEIYHRDERPKGALHPEDPGFKRVQIGVPFFKNLPKLTIYKRGKEGPSVDELVDAEAKLNGEKKGQVPREIKELFRPPRRRG